MPRQKVFDPHEAQQQVDIRFHKKAGRPKKEETDDPRGALAVGVVISPEKQTKKQHAELGSGADKYTYYTRALVANNGDIVKALAAAYNISEEAAAKDMVKLHDDIRSHSRAGVSLQEMLEKHDLTRETRLAVMREALFSPLPAVRLKAVEMLDEVDMTAKAARVGSTWDEIVRIAKNRAMTKKR